jgi:glucose/mannose transport system substrate-binding protein
VLWSDPDVRDALANYAKMMKYVNSDHAALTNMDAAGYVAEGKAAMNVMGDWVAGYYMSQGYVQGKEWDWVPTPGTNGSFIMLSDSFGLAKNAPNRENVIKWLEVCASQEGQDAFNPIKGSIPSRIDGDRSKYGAYLNAAMDDFATNDIVPSVAHGAAVSEAWVTKINDIMSVFTTDLDVDKAIKEFQAVADKYAPNKK